MNPAVLNETVLSIKNHLEKQLEKQWVNLAHRCKLAFASEKSFKNCQVIRRVGQHTIQRYLPKWSRRRIEAALSMLPHKDKDFR